MTSEGHGYILQEKHRKTFSLDERGHLLGYGFSACSLELFIFFFGSFGPEGRTSFWSDHIGQ